MLAVAEINPLVNKLPPVILAAEVIVDVTDINPPVRILPPVTLAVVITGPVNDTRLPVYVGRYAATLVFEYVPAIPVNCEPLPIK